VKDVGRFVVGGGMPCATLRLKKRSGRCKVITVIIFER
jgi:hypothetical protein